MRFHEGRRARPARARSTLALGVPPEAALGAWRLQAVQTEVFAHFAQGEASADGGCHWRVQGGDRIYEWDWHEAAPAERYRVRFTSEDVGALVRSAELSVTEALAAYGAEATLVVDYALPPSADEEATPDALTGRMLRQFKALLEAGELPLPGKEERREHRRPGATPDPRRLPAPVGGGPRGCTVARAR